MAIGSSSRCGLGLHSGAQPPSGFVVECAQGERLLFLGEAFGCGPLSKPQCLEVIDGSTGKALPVGRVVMLGDDVIGLGRPEQRKSSAA